MYKGCDSYIKGHCIEYSSVTVQWAMIGETEVIFYGRGKSLVANSKKWKTVGISQQKTLDENERKNLENSL
jgi:hypothetical protein